MTLDLPLLRSETPGVANVLHFSSGRRRTSVCGTVYLDWKHVQDRATKMVSKDHIDDSGDTL
jgi:hypothetical protein